MLILLTNYYPYFKGEEYLESEINYLSKRFNKIIIFPTLINKSMELTRKVPDNVEVFPITYRNTKFTKIRSAFNTIFKFDKVVNRIINKDSNNKLINKFYNYYFEGRTREVTKKIIEILKDQNLESQEVILYSYWFHATAKIAVNLKNELFKNNVKKLIVRGHRYDVDIEASPIKFLPMRKHLFENIDKLYCVSSTMSENLKSLYPEYESKIDYSRLGVKGTVDMAIASKNPFKIVSVSRIRKVKNVDKIIDSLSKIKELDYKWYHFGSGEELENMKKLAEDKLEKGSFHFMGEVNNEDLMKWYKKEQPSMFINLSSSEGIPVSIMEAMSFGIPVIATNVGGNKEIVKDSYNGYLIELSEIEEKVHVKIKEMYEFDDKNYRIFSENAFNIWEKEFNSEKNYDRFVNEI